MKKLMIALSFVALLAASQSCKKASSLLDPVSTTDLNEQAVFADSSRTMDFLFGIYANIPFDFEFHRYVKVRSGTSDICDESVNRYSNNDGYDPIITGALSAADAFCYQNDWSIPYQNIRGANLFLSQVDRSPISSTLKTESKGEARFLRDWYYTILMKYWGGVPLIKDTIFGIADNFTDVPRMSYADCVSYLVTDLDSAAGELPLQWDAGDYGRITKGAAMALKARVLLYAASPLFNGGNIGQTAAQKEVCGYPAYDQTLWTKAAQAAEDVVNLGVYSLNVDNTTQPGNGFLRVFLTRVNSEYIFACMQAPNKDMERYLFAPSRQGQAYSMPTENLAEAFGMNNGKPITDPASGFDPLNPYNNRDPRFYYTLVHNGQNWINPADNQMEPIWTYNGAASDGYGTLTYSGGYFWCKMMDPSISWGLSANTDRCLPMIRYADILLMDAEASNEIGNTDQAYKQLKAIRNRAGIQPGADGMYGLTPSMTKDSMRSAIQNEREVEFAYEDQRFWDLRRWKLGESVMNGLQLTAMRIDKQSNGSFTYTVVPINQPNGKLVFLERNYLFPMEQAELGRDPMLIQNPGY
jgi:hypothetical protein